MSISSLPTAAPRQVASIDLNVDGGANIVALLAQWGGAQLLEAGLIWLTLARYRGLVPLMWLMVTSEQALRIVIARRKPIVTRRTPPGAASNLLLPASLTAFLWALREPAHDAPLQPATRGQHAS